MKTPRELLLARHKAAGPRLDEIRHKIVDTIGARRPLFAVKLWEELILPVRHAWIGLAAAWTVILVLNLSSSGDASVRVSQTGPMNPDSVIALQRRERLMAHLVERDEEIAAPAKTPEQRPRSEAPVEHKIV
jgi:hypothetical protein